MNEKDIFPIIGINDLYEDHLDHMSLLRHNVNGKEVIDTPHKHDFFLIFLVLKGGGVHTIDFTDYEVRDNTLFFLAPGQVHKWKLNKNTEGFQFVFSGSFAEKLQRLHIHQHIFAENPMLELSEAETNELAGELIRIEEELITRDALSDMILADRLRIVLLLVERLQKKYAEERCVHPQGRIVLEFKSLIEKYFKEHCSVQFYADHLHITANYLNTICKKQLKQTAGEQIRNRIILEARRLLAVTPLSVKEIAYGLGFSDVAYFSRFFKKSEGMTPGMFRVHARKM
ncbi:helix-turn-helix domain-containing protein [Sinomicrobium weinanense]|nr:helix-turn-helix domain-containing protein [Sinomicrobium weinanense]